MTTESAQEQLASGVTELADEITDLASGFKAISLDDQDAQTQANAAAASATAAAASASAASTSATDASNSASSASTYAGNASTAASSASSSATAAANSATTAANSASAASTSASTASTAATNAATAASNALAAVNRLNSSVVAPVVVKGAQGNSIGAGDSYTVTASFTAPAAGWVVAFGHVNLAGSETSSLTFNLYINGTNMSGDATLLSQSHMGVLAVASGAAVTITFTGQNAGSSASTDMTQYVGGFFIPSSV
jgi:hypothetical protein